jgi:hypothetical protein
MISAFRSSDFQISGSAISSHKNIQLKPLSRKPHIIYGKNIPIFCPNSIGRRKTFGQMGILLVVLARFHQPPYKNI